MPYNLNYNNPLNLLNDTWSKLLSPYRGMKPPMTETPIINPINPMDGLLNKIMTPEPEQNKIFGMPATDFSKLLGSLAYAISPESPFGRMGAAVSGYATEKAKEPMLKNKALMDMATLYSNIENIKSQIAERQRKGEQEAEETRRWESGFIPGSKRLTASGGEIGTGAFGIQPTTIPPIETTIPQPSPMGGFLEKQGLPPETESIIRTLGREKFPTDIFKPKEEKLYEIGAGETLVTPTGEVKYKGAPKGKYEIGELIPVKVGENIVTKQVTGFDQLGMPTFSDYAKAPAKTTLSIEGLTKPTQTQLEEGIIEGEKRIMGLNETEKLFNSAFLEYKGKAISEVQKFADKLGLGTGTEFLQKRSAWMTQAKQEFLVYRKWVTGVAGGEKEYAEIAKAFPDPERNSPAEFMANLKQTKKWAAKLNNWLKYTRTIGLSITETPEEAEKAAKLMPKRLAPPGKTTIEDLSGKSVEELLEMFKGTE